MILPAGGRLPGGRLLGWGQGQYVSQADRKGDRQRVRNAGNRGERSDAENRDDASESETEGRKQRM